MNRDEVISAAGRLLAYRIAADVAPGLQAYSDDGDFIQVLSWRYDQGKQLLPHIHNEVPRASTVTQEAVIVLSGSLEASVYDDNRQLVKTVELTAGETMVFLAGGHGYQILADDTRVIEVKDGPYPGAEADRTRFKP
jgi:hypothetical protein